MLLRVLLLSLVLFGVSSASPASEFGVNQIMKVVDRATKAGHIDTLMWILNDTMSYKMCGYIGNKETFRGYLEAQLKSLNDVKFIIDYGNSYITEKDGYDYLTFKVETHSIYSDNSRVEGLASVTAVKKKYGNFFKVSHIDQSCRMTVKRHHRLYRVFTNEDLYDYRRK